MEHLYEEATQVVNTALEYHPENEALKRFKTSILLSEEKSKKQQQEFQEHVARQLEEERKKNSEAKTLKEKKCAAEKIAVVDIPLPSLSEEDTAVSRLHVYFQRIRHKVNVLERSQEEGNLTLLSGSL